MCILIAFHQSVPGCPIVVGANRDEHYDRPASPPGLLAREPSVWGGKDLRSGGTWLAVNEHGVLAALTNRRGGPVNPQVPSRGVICRDILAADSADEALHLLLDILSNHAFNRFNLYVSDGRRAFVAEYAEGRITETDQEPGVCVIANEEPNDTSDPRVVRVFELLQDFPLDSPNAAVTYLSRILADHCSGVSPQEMICVHGKEAGTVSSSILAIWPDRMASSIYLHLDGTPCASRFTRYSHLLRAAAAGGEVHS